MGDGEVAPYKYCMEKHLETFFEPKCILGDKIKGPEFAERLKVRYSCLDKQFCENFDILRFLGDLLCDKNYCKRAKRSNILM